MMKIYFWFQPQASDVINNSIQQLSIASEQEIGEIQSKRLSFVIEQLTLLQKDPSRWRYSTSFLWTAITWLKTSPALYRTLLRDNLICLPSISYLKQLSKAFSLETGLSKATLSYLKERVKHLDERQKTVALLIDEVSTF